MRNLDLGNHVISLYCTCIVYVVHTFAYMYIYIYIYDIYIDIYGEFVCIYVYTYICLYILGLVGHSTNCSTTLYEMLYNPQKWRIFYGYP